MFLRFRDKDRGIILQVPFNNQNYIPPIPAKGDQLTLKAGTTEREFTITERHFYFDMIGVEGVELEVERISSTP